MGVPQVREVRRTLGRLAKKRRKFLTSKAPGQHGKSEILSNWWRWKKLGGGEPGEKCDEVKAIEEKAWGWRQEVDGFGLHGPGAESQSEMMIPAGKVLHLDRLPAGEFFSFPDRCSCELTDMKHAIPALDTIRRAQLDGMLEEDDDDDDAGVWGEITLLPSLVHSANDCSLFPQVSMTLPTRLHSFRALCSRRISSRTTCPVAISMRSPLSRNLQEQIMLPSSTLVLVPSTCSLLF